MFSTQLAGEAHQGANAWSCVTATGNAYNTGNLGLPYLFGSRTIGSAWRIEFPSGRRVFPSVCGHSQTGPGAAKAANSESTHGISTEKCFVVPRSSVYDLVAAVFCRRLHGESEFLSEQAWGYFDYQNNLKKKCTILEYCRRVTGKRMPVVVSVFRDIQAVFSQNTSQLWFTFPFCSDMTDSWISRVLLASGAQPPRRSASCRRLYSCSQVDSSDIRRCAPSGVEHRRKRQGSRQICYGGFARRCSR